MLTLNTAGKSGNDALKVVKDSLAKSKDDEVRILIDSPAQAESLKKFLASQGFGDIMPEDDEGALYLTASKIHEHEDSNAPKTKSRTPPPAYTAPPSTTGVLISCRNKEYNSAFMKKFLASLVKAEKKPEIIALLDSAVKIAAYTSPLCAFLKRLEADGVRVLVSESCTDRLGMTEAAGAGIIMDMAEILSEIFSCSKVISV